VGTPNKHIHPPTPPSLSFSLVIYYYLFACSPRPLLTAHVFLLLGQSCAHRWLSFWTQPKTIDKSETSARKRLLGCKRAPNIWLTESFTLQIDGPISLLVMKCWRGVLLETNVRLPGNDYLDISTRQNYESGIRPSLNLIPYFSDFRVDDETRRVLLEKF
jgi:hypothetical protein